MNTLGLRLLSGVCLICLQISAAASAEPFWYRCIVKSSSHTGIYTFQISEKPCSVYWREIDAKLKIRDCELPIIAALKPSARDDLSVVWFDISTGSFYDYLSGVKDRGKCTRITNPTG